MTNTKTICFTGGHHNSALVVAKELISRGHKVVWIGHRFSSHGDQNDSAEYIEVKNSGIPFHNLVAGKSTLSLKSLVNFPLGIMRAHRLLLEIQPDAIVTFGGYLGLAVSVAAHLHRLPIFLHEQTVVAGKANLLTAKISRWNYLTWDSSRKFYPAGNTSVIGLPLRPGFTTKKRLKSKRKRILVMGGKLGSHIINQVVFDALGELLQKFQLIHQTGTSSVTKDYERAISLKESLPPSESANYSPRGYIGEDEMPSLMSDSDLVISRSGAHTTYELGLLGKKSILIPFLSTHKKEQLQNARFLRYHGIATILPQSKLTTSSLNTAIKTTLSKGDPSPIDLPTESGKHMASHLLSQIA